VAFDGVVFIPDVDRPKDDRASFTAAVKPVSGSFEGARAAAFYHGTRYCVQNYGTSHIKWTIGPDTPAEQLRIEKDSLAYQGRCYP
jgi:hypothetical protein